MKCLSVRQPWAAWILMEAKDVENRTWATRYRGPLLIHAGAREDPWVNITLGALPYEATWRSNRLSAHLRRNDLDRWNAAHTCGAILGWVNLVDCRRDCASPWYEKGAIGWVLAEPVIFSEPIPYRGRLGLMNVPDELLREHGHEVPLD